MANCFSSINTPEYKPLVNAAIATTLAVGAVCTPWETTKIIGLTVLNGIGYGIVNDMITFWGCSCRFCPQHFSGGYIPVEHMSNLSNHRIYNLNPSLNAIAKGMIGYWSVSATAGTVFAIIARASLPVLGVKIKATQITSYLTISAALITLVVQVSAQAIKKYYNANQQVSCDIQHAASYGILVSGNILLGVAILVARFGLIRL